MAIYRRHAIYWWRRTFRPAGGEVRPITIRISLRTACAQEAKARAAHLEVNRLAVMGMAEAALRPNLTREDLARVYHLAFKAELDRIVVKQAATPMSADGHAAANLIYARLFTVFARCSRAPEPGEDFRRELIEAGLTPQEAYHLHVTLQRHAGALPIMPSHIGAYLEEAGVFASDLNRQAVGRIVAAAYRNACLAGSELLGRPVPPGTVWPLAGNLMGILGIDAPEHDQPDPATAPDQRAVEPAPATVAATAAVPDVTISQIAEIALTAKIADGSWDEERRRDVDAAVRLFRAANGDVFFGTIRQDHLAATVALFHQLPTRYGSVRKDPSSGEMTQESVEAALIRGADLLTQHRHDPVAAQAAGSPTVGLSPVTRRKHLTWLSALVTFAKAAGRPHPTGLDFAALRREINKASHNRVTRHSSGKKKNAALSAWAKDDLRHAFTAPVWHGCAGLWKRFEPGREIFHDGCYFAPLTFVLTACKSDEGTGLALDDIYDEADVPFFHSRVNRFRRIKTASSDRRVPIHPLMIDLGFLDYVRAMRDGGHEALYPEFLHLTMGFDHIFYDKVFETWRKTMFPNGTSRKKDNKDVDVRSIRSRCITHLEEIGCPKALTQAIVGHEVGDVTSDTYREDPAPELFLPWVTQLGALLPPIKAYPLRLRPPEWQKFGAPRGRPGGWKAGLA